MPEAAIDKHRNALLLKRKSGLPKTLAFRRQPAIQAVRKISIIRSSVSRFPLARIRDITLERFLIVNTSAHWLFVCSER
jgi:hypothetical protein